MKVNCIIFFVLAFVFTSSAQITTPNDSVSTGSNNTDMVFYQLSTGQKTSTSNTNWHMAISIRPTAFPAAPLGGTTIRINEANGVHVRYVPNANAAEYNNVDTTGWQAWPMLHDADSILDEGALNANRSAGIFDFGWGVYNSVSHDVVGDSLYLIELPDGSLKKFIVVNLDRDTAYNIKYSNIDNSNLQELHISKKDYLGKSFVYLNLYTNAVEDKEPASTDWDLLFIEYAARDVVQGSVVAKVGVLANKTTTVGKANGNAAFYTTYQGSYSSMMNAIGWNWNNYDSQNDVYTVEDSLAYFVRDYYGMAYKLSFTSYAGPSTGVISFYKENQTATGIPETETTSLALYPNPANDILTIVSNITTTANISDLSGRLIDTLLVYEGNNSYATSTLPNGIYLLGLGKGQAVKKLVIQHN